MQDPQIDNLLIIVNSPKDKAHNQYAAYVVAFMAKQIAKIKKVTVYYGPQGVEISKKGTLASFPLESSVKRLVADQLDGVSASDLPDNLEQFARFLKEQVGVNIASCGTFHVISGFAKTAEDASNIEDFITPVNLSQAAEAILSADKILYF